MGKPRRDSREAVDAARTPVTDDGFTDDGLADNGLADNGLASYALTTWNWRPGAYGVPPGV